MWQMEYLPGLKPNFHILDPFFTWCVSFKIVSAIQIVLSAEHLVFSRLVRQPKSHNFRTLVLYLLLCLGLTV